jgi:hypothetical protein
MLLSDVFDGIFCLALDERLANKQITIVDELLSFDREAAVQLLLVGNGNLYPGSAYFHIDVDVPGRKQAYNYGLCLRKILSLARENGCGNFLFLEDDAVFTPRFTTLFPLAVEELREFDLQWDMLFIGGNHVNGVVYGVPGCKYVIRPTYSLDMHAVAFNASAYDRIIGINPSAQHTMDGIIGEAQKKGELKALAFHPSLITQKPGWSKNENRLVDRSVNHWI